MRRSSTLLVLLALVCTRDAAAAPNQALETCSADAESGQRLQRAGKVLDARDKMRDCARETCPDEIVRFCMGRLGELERDVPTFVVAVRDAMGNDRADFDVLLDGVAVGQADGRGIEANPGPHRVSARKRDGVETSAEASFVLVQGEKLHFVSLTVGPPPPPRTTPASGSPRPLVLGLAAGGLAAIVTGAIFWGSALSSRSDALEAGGCAPRCSDDTRDSIRDRIIVGDTLMIAGVVASGIAAYLFFTGNSRVDQRASR